MVVGDNDDRRRGVEGESFIQLEIGHQSGGEAVGEIADLVKSGARSRVEVGHSSTLRNQYRIDQGRIIPNAEGERSAFDEAAFGL